MFSASGDGTEQVAYLAAVVFVGVDLPETHYLEQVERVNVAPRTASQLHCTDLTMIKASWLKSWTSVMLSSGLSLSWPFCSL